MNNNNFIIPPDPARIMESLRDTGYDFNTAIADLVDNSISAFASVIKVYIDLSPNNEITVYIADNGCGMDLDGLKNAMKYGSLNREDPSSLGKYGLGLKTASTAFCRSLSLLSKTKKSDYNKVCWDLDNICETNQWSLLHLDLDEDEVDMLNQVTNGESGTLVIWNKVDRLIKNSSSQGIKKAMQRIISSLKLHLSMVFERFLDKEFTNAPNIDIFINEEQIEPWDPFCKKEEHTIKMPSKPVVVEGLPGKKNSSFTVNAYILPRKDDFSTPENYSKALINNDLEGFYIYRENRLIHFGDWLKINKNDPHFSLLRVDFSFDHTLDDAFNVDIKKSRIALNEEIFNYLKDTFLPSPRRAAEELYRKGKTSVITTNSKGAHSSSNTNIETKAPNIQNADVAPINDKQVEVSNKNGKFITDKIKIKESPEKDQTRIIPVSSIDANMLWEPTVTSDGKLAVSINQSHPYYEKVYAPVIDSPNLVTGMDALLWALSEAEISTYNLEVKENYEDMRVEVSKILKKLLSDLPEVEIGD